MSACSSGKRRYPNENHAQAALRRIWSQPRSGRRLENRAYQCELCHGWHLTSKALRPERNAS